MWTKSHEYIMESVYEPPVGGDNTDSYGWPPIVM